MNWLYHPVTRNIMAAVGIAIAYVIACGVLERLGML